MCIRDRTLGLPGLKTGSAFGAGSVPNAGDGVKTVLLYVKNAQGEEILVSQNDIGDMYDYLQENPDTIGELYNYSLLDSFVTPVHQEAQGFTIPQLLEYAQKNSSAASVKELPLTFGQGDEIAVWSKDSKAGFIPANTFRYEDLYGSSRYNFPALYEHWDYDTQGLSLIHI